MYDLSIYESNIPEFRAWHPGHPVDGDKQKGEMLYGERFNLAAWLHTSGIQEDVTNLLMQYTGCKDRNGTKIFEADLYKVWEKDKEEDATIEFIGDIREIFITNHPLYNTHYSYGVDYCIGEVVGNIFENMDLITDPIVLREIEEYMIKRRLK